MNRPTTPVPTYRRIAQDAWRIAWQHQHLWIFGFFATLIGFGGVFEVVVGAYERSTRLFPMIAAVDANPLLALPGATTIKGIILYTSAPVLSMLVFAAIIAVAFAVFAWVITLAISALVASVGRIARGGDLAFPEAVHEGSKHLLPVFTVNAVLKAFIWLLFFLTGTNLLALLVDSDPLSALLYLAAFVLFTGIAILASILQVFATNAVVLDGDGFFAALRHGWDVLRHHWLISLEMVLVLMLITLFAAAAAGIAGIILFLPVALLMFLAIAVGAPGAILWLLIIAGFVGFALLVAFCSFISTFQGAAWTLLWIDLRKQKHGAQLEHWKHRLFGKA